MGKRKHVDRFFDPLGFDPFSFSLSPSSSGSSGSGGSSPPRAGFTVEGKVKLKKDDLIGVSAVLRDFNLEKAFGKEALSLFNMKGEGEFTIDASGLSEPEKASAKSHYHGKGVKDLFSAILAEHKEGELGKVSEETEIVKVTRGSSALAQGYATIDKGTVDIVGEGSVEAGSSLRALKELKTKIAEESKGKAQAVAQISKSLEGKELMQRLGAASAHWNVSGGQLNIRKQVMMLDG